MTAHRSPTTVALALVATGLLGAGCSGQPGTGAIATAAAPSAVPSAPSALVSASIEPSAGPQRASPVVEPAMPEPPAASIAVEGGDPVAGELGSFTWKNGGSDGPWVPGAPIRVGRGERLTLTLAADIRITDWTVSRTPSATVGSGVIGMGEGSGDPVTFAAPPSGTWSLNVDVWFADNLGSAAYYWLITVN